MKKHRESKKNNQTLCDDIMNRPHSRQDANRPVVDEKEFASTPVSARCSVCNSTFEGGYTPATNIITVTYSELEKGDMIHHAMWGPITFHYREGSRHFFTSKKWGNLDLLEFGARYRKISKA